MHALHTRSKDTVRRVCIYLRREVNLQQLFSCMVFTYA